MKVYTTLKVLKRAWAELKEMKLEGLLSDGKVNINIVELIDILLAEGKLNKFCQIITQSDVDFEDMELEDVMEVISDFFQNIGSAFQKTGLPIQAVKK